MKTVAEKDMTEKLMQFLVGLNASFNQMREQILLMDPLPDVYKAYCLMLLVEKPMNPQQFLVENVAAVRPKNNRF